MADPQKIVHIIGTLSQFDASHSLRELARHQAASGEETAVLAFMASSEARKQIAAAGVNCQIIRKRWGYDPFAARQLVQSLKELEPSLVHLWGRRATDAGLTVRRAAPNASVLASLVKVPQLANPWWPNRSLEALDAIVVERDHVRDQFVDAGQGESRVHVIPPGIASVAQSSHSRRELFIHLGLPNEARVIAIAGSLERWQLIDEAIWAFELIRILHDSMHLVIVGDGPELARLQRFARQVTDPGAVHFVQKVDLLEEIFAHTEVYWQPGESDTIPLALLKAMSAQLPVVASDVPAHRAVIRAARDGMLVPCAKRALWARHTDELIRSESLRSQLAKAAKQTVDEKFSLNKMTQSYDELYREIAARKSPAFS